MQTAILYIRVSTDEQALKGYSQKTQAERLQKFCTSHQIHILQSIFEDHSAKTFHRPEWSKLMQILNRNKADRPDLLLFTRWDRFSRNTADAYYMITQLQKLGVEPQAIDQSLDMSIPENKVLLAMYIVTSEVENDRRSLNVKHGIYKAKQEGRWIGHAPIGFITKSSASGKKIITPYEPEASLVKKAFTRLVQQNTSIRLLYQQSILDGLKCSLSNFWNLLHNPVYCGRIRIPVFEGQPAYEVKGIHEPIVTEYLFEQVQQILGSRKRRTYANNKPASDLLPLRGFIYCPVCFKKLSGSGSAGHAKRYYYYHCHASCGFRIRADKTNSLFQDGINKLKAGRDYIDLYREILQQEYCDLFKKQRIDQAYITGNIEKLIDRAAKSRELLIKGTIDDEDYLAIKSDCEQRIHLLGIELHEAYIHSSSQKHYLKDMAKQLSDIGSLYQNSSVFTKREIISLLLEGQLIFDEVDFNHNLNTTTKIIYNIATRINDSIGEEVNVHQSSALQRDQMLCRILNIEMGKGHYISIETCRSILHFLTTFARIHMTAL